MQWPFGATEVASVILFCRGFVCPRYTHLTGPVKSCLVVTFSTCYSSVMCEVLRDTGLLGTDFCLA